jgi:hypothetical protein
MSSANESKVQVRKDGTAYVHIPAFVRAALELRAGTVLRWVPSAGAWLVQVVGHEEPRRRG